MSEDVLMQLAWRDCVLWAMAQEEVVSRFTADTGLKLSRPTSPLDQMIDEATGYRTAVLGKFVEWFNVNVWGDYPPVKAREERDG